MSGTDLTPTVSIVIPVYNGGAGFRRCLASFQTGTVRPDELIVVADGDSDGSWRVAESLGARILRLPETGGPARARNAGARLARGDVLFFVDADVVVHSDALGRVVAAFRDNPELAALFGSYDDAPAEPNFLSQYRNLLHHFVHQSSREQASTFWSGCGAIRREIFLGMGGFDEHYRHPSIEDIELGYRLARAGHPIKLCKDIQATHLKEWRAGSLLRTDLFRRAVPWTELILRDRRFINDLNLRSSGRMAVILTYLALLCLVCAVFRPWLVALGGVCILAMLAMNAQLFRFFFRKRGVLFALAAVPWVCLYQIYSGLGFFMGVLRHLAARVRGTR